MKKEKIIIGSRGSKLALIYAQKVKNKILENSEFREDQIIIKEIITKGDQVQDKRLSEVGGKGLFSKNIEKELLEDRIDIAVHALKDMPAIETKGLLSNFFLNRNDPREILISRHGIKLQEIKTNSIIGTSSFRREFQIKRLKENISCKLIRGNVDTRIRKLKEGLYDAIILSLAGIQSLGLEKEITQIFLTDEIIPSAGQGIICAQCKENNSSIIELLNKINDPSTYKCAVAERDVLKILEGDCETAVGAHAVLKNDKIELEVELFSLDGIHRYYEIETKEIDKNIKCFCVGLATEKKAKSAGFQNIITAEGNVRNLKELILQNFNPSDGDLVYVSGEIISSDLDQQLINDGYSVKRLINYKTNHNKIYDDNFVEKLKGNIPNIVYIYSYNSALSFLNFIKNENLQSFWMDTNLMCMGEKTSSILNEIKWKKIFLFNPGEEEYLLYKI